MQIEISVDPAVCQSIDAVGLAKQLERTVPLLPRPLTSLSILIVADGRMREMHARHFGEDTTTDVISFNLARPDEPIEAELIIGADAAAREAASRQISIHAELLLYAIHGMLHAAGFADDSEEALRTMRAQESRLMDAAVGR